MNEPRKRRLDFKEVDMKLFSKGKEVKIYRRCVFCGTRLSLKERIKDRIILICRKCGELVIFWDRLI